MKFIILTILTMFDATPVSNVISHMSVETASHINEPVALTCAARGIQG